MRNFVSKRPAGRLRLLASLAVALAASAMVSTSVLADDNPQNPCSATGTGEPCVIGAGTQLQYGVVPPPYGFAVFAVGTGPAARGYLASTSPFGTGGPNYLARVTCLKVTGNSAIATGIYIAPNSSSGQRVVMQAVDNGGGNPPADLLRFSFTGFIVPDPTDTTGNCWLPLLPPVAIQSGHIAVGRTSQTGG